MLALLVDALVYGNLLALLSVGLSLTLLTTKVSNFAHGDFAVIGIYIAYTLSQVLNVTPYAFIPVAFVGGALVGLAVYFLVFDPLRDKASFVTLMIVSMALEFILRYSVQIYADVMQRWLKTFGRGFMFNDVRLALLGLHVDGVVVYSSITTLSLLVLLYVFLYRTKTGTAMRAAIENPQLAQTLGINVRKVYAYSWMLSAGFAAAAGVFLPFKIVVNPDTGFSLLLSMFAAVTVGGLGSLAGSLVGAYLISFSEIAATYFLSSLGLSTSYRALVSFLSIAVVLLLSPRGLAGLWSKR